MTDARDWEGRVGANWAREWVRTDRSFAGLTTRLAQRVSEGKPQAVLDIGCGAGELSLAVKANRPDTRVCGIDLSADLIVQARLRADESADCHFEVSDASHWVGADFTPDLLMSRHGVMFFDDPVGAFTHLAQVSAPAAQLIFSCFCDRNLNTWATAIAELLPDAAPVNPHAPGPFAFADQTHVSKILAASGWAEVQFERVDWEYVAGAGADPVSDAVNFFSRIGPAAPVIAALEGAERTMFLERVHALATDRLVGDEVQFQAAGWIVSAQSG